jgi:hypothetical protein
LIGSASSQAELCEVVDDANSEIEQMPFLLGAFDPDHGKYLACKR